MCTRSRLHQRSGEGAMQDWPGALRWDPGGGASVDVAKGAVRAGERTAGWIDTRTEVEAGEGYGKGLGTGRANIQIPG